MKKLLWISSLLFTVLSYSQPGQEMQISKIQLSLSYECDEIESFFRDKMSFIDNNKSIVNFYTRSYKIDYNTKSSIVKDIVKLEVDLFQNNQFSTIFYPFYQHTGWEKSVRKEDLIMEWQNEGKLMKIIVKLDTYKMVDLINPPYVKICFKPGTYEINDLIDPMLRKICEE